MIDINLVVGMAGVPFILALTQMVKRFVADERYYPIISIVWGIVINVGIIWGFTLATRQDIVVAIFTGVVAGLAAAGMYSAVTTFHGETPAK